MSVKVIIKHKRFEFASDRGRYLVDEKKSKGRANYLSTGDGERVGRLWGKLKYGIPVRKFKSDGVTLQDNGKLLLINTNTFGRNQVIEFLISADVRANKAEANAVVEEVTESIMRVHFPGIPWVAARHADRPHSHVHLLIVNDRGNGQSIQIGDDKFYEIRRDVNLWCKAGVTSGWGNGKPLERRLTKLTKWQVEQELKSKRLVVKSYMADGKTPDKMFWKPKGSVGAAIRWWVASKLTTSLSYDMVELLIAFSKTQAKMDRLEAAEYIPLTPKQLRTQAILGRVVAALAPEEHDVENTHTRTLEYD